MKKKIDDKICVTCKYYGINFGINMRVCILSDKNKCPKKNNHANK